MKPAISYEFEAQYMKAQALESKTVEI